MKDLVDSGNVANEKDIIPQRELKFSDVLKILYENIFVLLISALVVSAVVFGITKFLVTPKYESFTTLYVVNNPQNGEQSARLTTTTFLRQRALQRLTALSYRATRSMIQYLKKLIPMKKAISSQETSLPSMLKFLFLTKLSS